MKRGRPIGSKDKTPYKIKGANILDENIEDIYAPKEAQNVINEKPIEEDQVSENIEKIN